MTEDKPIIRVRGLVNRFGEQVVHDGLDLDVRRGEILGIVGGSGTGKSVLMRSILGLRIPDEGEIEVLGVDARSEEEDIRLVIERNRACCSRRRTVLLAHGRRERAGAAEGTHRTSPLPALRTLAAESETGGPPAMPAKSCRAVVPRHAQARGTGACTRAGSALAVPRRNHRWVDPSRRRIRRTDPHAATRAGAHGVLVTHDLDTLYAICDTGGGARRRRG